MKVEKQEKSSWLRTIAHIDVNSYFATILQQENPQLRNRPVGVIKSEGRSCLIAVSKEAKKRGIKTGDSLLAVQHLAPDLVLVPAQFDFMLDATRRLQAIFKSLAPQIEMFSLDEAFLDLSGCERLYPDLQAFGRLAQRRVKEELGEWVTCNVGISYNRFLAKIASETSPKGTVSFIDQHNLNHVLCTTAFNDVCGVGSRLAKKLRAVGVHNLYQLNLVDDETLKLQVGSYWLGQLRLMAAGKEPDLLRRLADPLPHMKSVGRSITGYQLLDDEQAIRQVLYNLVAETTHKARQMNLRGRYVSLALWGQGKDKHFWHAHLTLPYYLNQSLEMWQVIWDELYRSWQRPWPVIKFAVRLGMLQPDTQVPRRLWPQLQKRQSLEEAIDKLSQKYGLFTVRPGTLLSGELIRPEVTGFLGDKLFQL